ncbi:FAD-dependent monooxygenase [Nonomuraea sp. NPDC049695]|uniref:FAD-dependent oxidoreductase n=1 Tax=Nonomuraea sp. NPDC049695 TaxID=3154734 RepID=UPI00341A0F01
MPPSGTEHHPHDQHFPYRDRRRRPGRLVCARILQNHGIGVTVLEREADLTARSQGGTLDIQAPTGQVALRSAGLFDQFLALSRPEGQEVRRMDRNAAMVRHSIPDAEDTAAPEIDRGQPHALLMDSLLPGPLDWNAGLDPDDTDALRARLLEMYQGWDESLLAMLRLNEGPFVNRPIFVLPVPHIWERVPGITLLGDAAHLMPPAGVGANLAMLDGAELAQAIIGRPTIKDALAAYEAVMLPRSVSEAERTGELLAVLMPDTEPLLPSIRSND